MLSTAILALAAFAAGVTGAWSPCGFSMVETLAGAAGREGRAGRRLVRVSCATFAVGAVLGGALTFTALSGLGVLLGAGGTAALIVAAAIALAAAAADALGVRVAPQIRRQVPEPWRRTLPLPLAAVLYGILLGLGFTTFVLAFAVWALAGIAVALGAPATGLAIGIAFGLGRALPVAALAPRHDTLGARLHTRMAEEPRLLRRLRLADAALLAAAAVALALGPPAAAADAQAVRPTLVSARATTPSADGTTLAWKVAGREQAAVLQQGAAEPARLPAAGVAIGGGHLALAGGDDARTISVTRLADGAPVATVPAAMPAIDLAVSAGWLVWRSERRGGGEQLRAVALGGGDDPGAAPPPGERPAALVARTARRGTLGRPALDGDRLAYAVGGARGTRIVVRDLVTGRRRVALRSRRTQLAQPALLGERLLYVESRACDQRLRLRGAGALTRTLLRLGGTAHRDRGHEHGRTRQGNRPSGCPAGTPRRTSATLLTTALALDAAYVTRWNPRTRRADLLRIGR